MSIPYAGHTVQAYPDYLDAATGRTLVAEPGRSYDPVPASGRPASLPAVPGDGRWGSTAMAAGPGVRAAPKRRRIAPDPAQHQAAPAGPATEQGG